MKKVIIEMIFNDNEGIIQHSQETFHESFVNEQDYIESNVVVSTDIPYDSEKGFVGDESRLTVDFTTCVNKKEIAYKVIEALGEQLKHVPGVIGEILDGEDKKENE